MVWLLYGKFFVRVYVFTGNHHALLRMSVLLKPHSVCNDAYNQQFIDAISGQHALHFKCKSQLMHKESYIYIRR